ncbi:NINE protein [Candidatus Poribacteria bacterium]
MFCRNCGKEVADQAVVCVSCGAPPKGGQKFCQNCGAETDPLAEVCVTCGVKLAAAVPENAKSKLVAGILGIFLGGFGVHRFYLGYTGIGIVQIIVTIVTVGAGSLWGLIEGILILTGSVLQVDAKGQPLKNQ